MKSGARSSADTNVFVRLILGDDRQQFDRVRKLFDRCKIGMLPTVFLECGWVLESRYDYSREQVVLALGTVLGFCDAAQRYHPELEAALVDYQSGMDLADAVHVHCAVEYDSLFTFDRKFASRVLNRSAPTKVLDLSIP